MTNNESESRCASPAFAVAFGKEATRAQLWRWRCAGEAGAPFKDTRMTFVGAKRNLDEKIRQGCDRVRPLHYLGYCR
jgi:hypothetical protein